MNNIHAEVDEIFRTNNKKAVVSLFLSMQGNYIRAVEAETRLTKAQAEIERKDELIEQMRDALLLFAEGAIHDFHYVCQHRDNCSCLACQKARVKAPLWRQKGGE